MKAELVSVLGVTSIGLEFTAEWLLDCVETFWNEVAFFGVSLPSAMKVITIQTCQPLWRELC